MISVSHVKDTFILKCKRKSEARLAERCGFMYDPINRHFITNKKRSAVRFREFFDKETEKLFMSSSVNVSLWPDRSPTLHPPHLKLDLVQLEAVRFCLDRNHSYLALEQRIGKTPTAIAVMNAVDESCFHTAKFLLVVPPFLVSNWSRELQKWFCRPFLAMKVTSGGPIFTDKNFNILIIPDSLVIDKGVKDFAHRYDYDLLIVDEAHRMNNDESQRTQFLYGSKNYDGIIKKCEKVVLLSGTPMRNRPIDLWPVLSNLAHDTIDFRSKGAYAFKYCDGHVKTKEFYKRGKREERKVLDARGSSKEKELAQKLEKFMKVEKFKDHFEVNETETITLLDSNKTAKITKLEETVLQKKSLEELVGSSNLGDIASLRRAMSEIKFPVAREYIENALNSTEDKFLVFGFHIDLLEKLYDHFLPTGAFLINGKTPMYVRTKIEKDFNEGKTRIGFANIFTMQGIDLSAANRNIFVESSWGPSDNDQAKFRIYGRRQKKNVYTEHLVLAGTLDEYVMQKVLDKKETINKIIRKKEY